MTLELLICTLDAGIERIEGSLLPCRNDVCYLISWQYTGEQPSVPLSLQEREDVRVVMLQGRGLSRNRNHALKHAQGDILKICDDDEKWTMEDIDTILQTYRQHPEYDIVHFQIEGVGKKYPNPSVASCEMTMRRERVEGLRFDERFGLGSPFLLAGEEDVFLCDARRRGLNIHYEPKVICYTPGPTTGSRIEDPRMQRSKGAVFYYTGGLTYALCKSARESLGWMARKHMNPLALFCNMLWGINYIRKWHP